MKYNRLFTTAVLLVSLPLAGCQTMTPEQKAVLAGAIVGIAAGGIAAASGANAGKAIGIGVAAGAATGVAVYVIAKRRASEMQMVEARRRAMQWEARNPAPSVPSPSVPKPKSRYVAVETPRDSSSVGTSSVMLWDTQSDKLVTTNVYDLKSSPQVGSVAYYDNYPAVYIASGR